MAQQTEEDHGDSTVLSRVWRGRHSIKQRMVGMARGQQRRDSEDGEDGTADSMGLWGWHRGQQRMVGWYKGQQSMVGISERTAVSGGARREDRIGRMQRMASRGQKMVGIALRTSVDGGDGTVDSRVRIGKMAQQTAEYCEGGTEDNRGW